MGDEDIGKSTTIRDLTGFGMDWKSVSKHRRAVAIKVAKKIKTIVVYIFLKALQEDGKIKTAVYKLLKNNKCENILVALRIKKRSGWNHIRRLQQYGTIAEPVIVLIEQGIAQKQKKWIQGEFLKLRLKYRIIPVNFKPRDPANGIAAEIRKRWKWL
jgi:hypothetical protein